MMELLTRVRSNKLLQMHHICSNLFYSELARKIASCRFEYIKRKHSINQQVILKSGTLVFAEVKTINKSNFISKIINLKSLLKYNKKYKLGEHFVVFRGAFAFDLRTRGLTHDPPARSYGIRHDAAFLGRAVPERSSSTSPK